MPPTESSIQTVAAVITCAARCRACASRLVLRPVALALRDLCCALSRLRFATCAAPCRACASRLVLRPVALALRPAGLALRRPPLQCTVEFLCKAPCSLGTERLTE